MDDQMTNAALDALIAKARTVQMTEDQLRGQRLSFVYGNTHIENAMISREMVEQADEKITREEVAQKAASASSEPNE